MKNIDLDVRFAFIAFLNLGFDSLRVCTRVEPEWTFQRKQRGKESSQRCLEWFQTRPWLCIFRLQTPASRLFQSSRFQLEKTRLKCARILAYRFQRIEQFHSLGEQGEFSFWQQGWRVETRRRTCLPSAAVRIKSRKGGLTRSGECTCWGCPCRCGI